MQMLMKQQGKCQTESPAGYMLQGAHHACEALALITVSCRAYYLLTMRQTHLSCLCVSFLRLPSGCSLGS